MDHLHHQLQFKPNSSWSSDVLHIQGGYSLHGEVLLGGSKNAALPIIVAAILGIKEIILQNVPTIQDIKNILNIIETLGVEVNWQTLQHQVTLKTDQMRATPLTHPLMQSMRASFLLAAPMLARFGHVTLLFPGGDAIGIRPVNYHLQGFQQLGAIVDVQQSHITMTAKNGLKGAIIHLPFPSVGATQNLMMAACCARGETVIRQAAQEPE
ncbi:MAG TPA: UDP-N-acetylglucosamine 1-carboxyvinyltransferase, partial [Alphaproteobacteria bacterium]|nr:UDP-N-acetylglucosamine 1-carboxyvinyltransferase [Alphaproteobacteria bacterium]